MAIKAQRSLVAPVTFYIDDETGRRVAVVPDSQSVKLAAAKVYLSQAKTETSLKDSLTQADLSSYLVKRTK